MEQLVLPLAERLLREDYRLNPPRVSRSRSRSQRRTPATASSRLRRLSQHSAPSSIVKEERARTADAGPSQKRCSYRRRSPCRRLAPSLLPPSRVTPDPISASKKAVSVAETARRAVSCGVGEPWKRATRHRLRRSLRSQPRKKKALARRKTRANAPRVTAGQTFRKAEAAVKPRSARAVRPSLSKPVKSAEPSCRTVSTSRPAGSKKWRVVSKSPSPTSTRSATRRPRRS